MVAPTDKDDRKSRIVDGLMAVVAERGYERATISAIARAAGVSPSLVRYHFESQLEILEAVGARLLERIQRRYEDRVRKGEASPRGRLDAFLDAHLARGEDEDMHAVACWVSLGAEAQRREDVGTLYRGITTQRASFLRQLLRDVLLAEGRSTARLGALSAAAMALIEGYYRLASSAPEVVPRGTGAEMTRAALAALLDAQPLDD